MDRERSIARTVHPEIQNSLSQTRYTRPHRGQVFDVRSRSDKDVHVPEATELTSQRHLLLWFEQRARYDGAGIIGGAAGEVEYPECPAGIQILIVRQIRDSHVQNIPRSPCGKTRVTVAHRVFSTVSGGLTRRPKMTRMAMKKGHHSSDAPSLRMEPGAMTG